MLTWDFGQRTRPCRALQVLHGVLHFRIRRQSISSELPGYWYNAPLITGRILHGQGNESYEQIALRAMRFDSPLAKAADALFQLSDVVSIVDVCLTTASNFGGRSSKQDLAAITGNLSDSNPDMLPWERMLYHKRTDAQDGTRQPNTSSSSSPSSTHVLGAAVTSKDALSTCYAILFHYLSLLLNSPSD